MALGGSSLNRQTLESIKTQAAPVIIFGAGVVGEVVFHSCRDAGIEVECFCDNSIIKTRSSLCDRAVIDAHRLKAKYPDAVLIISVADIRDVVDQLSDLGYPKWYAGSLLLRDFDIYKYQYSAPMDFVEYAVGTCLLCHDSYSAPNKLFLRSVDIIITERCSLKCRDCSNLMQYYRKPADCSIEEIMQTIDVFCAFIDEVNEFRVIGGEPFIHGQFHLIVKRLIEEPKVKRIVIYTNGTILPKGDQIECLKNKKVLVFVTDYGVLSRKIQLLTQVMLQNGIAFYAARAKGWTDCGKIARRFRSIEQRIAVFQGCCAKNLATLSNGKLYRCPFAANIARLSAVPDCENDYVNLFQEPFTPAGISGMKKKIGRFLLEKDSLDACDYCNGRSFEAHEIQPAIQTKKPLEYVQYNVKC